MTLRNLVPALIVVLICGSGLLAAEHTGKMKQVDHDKMTLTITVDGKDVTFKFNEDTQVVNENDKPLALKLKAMRFKQPVTVTVTSEKKGDDTIATKVKAGQI